MSDFISEFRDAMAAAGVATSDPLIGDSKIHRVNVVGDKRGKRNGWYLVHLNGTPAGAFGNMKTGEKHTYSAKGTTPLTPEERRAMAAKVKADRAAREARDVEAHRLAAIEAEALWNSAVPATDHPYLTRKKIQPHGARVADWVKTYIDPETGEVTETRVPNALLIAIRDVRKKINSVQAIFATKALGGRDKDFLSGGQKRACFYSIGTPKIVNGKLTLIIGEGFSTCASLYESTGIGTVCAFDAGNLLPVAQEVRRVMPDAVIILAADDDRKTKGNPGITYATAASQAVGGIMVAPFFSSPKPRWTDFNDLCVAEGPTVVAAQILAALLPPEPVTDAVEPPEPPPYDAVPESGETPDVAPVAAQAVAAALTGPDDVDAHDPTNFFKILGHDRERIYIYQYEMKMIISRRITDWDDNALTSLADPFWWESEFHGDKGVNKKGAINWIIRAAFRRGFFDPNVVRGRGAWLDDDRIVYHFGNAVMVDGVQIPVAELKSRFVYEQGRHLPVPTSDALTDAEGRHLFEVAKMFRWRNPASAILTCGWGALAPVCGAIKWRPHILCTGSAGSGKSTLLSDFLKPMMAGTALFAMGHSTEAGIRQELQCDALPVMFDEAEQRDDSAVKRVQNIIALARQSSTESDAKTYKGTSGGSGMKFIIRSMFVFSSIQVNLETDADRDRIAVLNLRDRRRDGDQGDNGWPALKAELVGIGMDKTLPGRVMRRAIDNLPLTLKNIEVFTTAAAKHFSDQRLGDQYGTLLAGAWSLISRHLARPEQAEAMLARYDWSEYLEHSETDDSVKALSALMGALIRGPRGDTLSVFELVSRALDRDVEGIEFGARQAETMLRRHGIGVVDNEVLISQNSQEINRLMVGTAFETDVRGSLLRHRAARRIDTPTSFNGVKDRAIALSCDALSMDEYRSTAHRYEPGEDDPPF